MVARRQYLKEKLNINIVCISKSPHLRPPTKSQWSGLKLFVNNTTIRYFERDCCVSNDQYLR